MPLDDISGKNIVVAGHGTRGDVQPLIALSYGLMKVGFNVTLFTNPDHEKFVTEMGIGFCSNHFPWAELFFSDAVSKAFAENKFMNFLAELGKGNQKYGQAMYTAYYKLLQKEQPAFVIACTQHWYDAVLIPRLLRIPTLPMTLANSMTLDPYKAPFGMPSLPCGMNGPLWKLVFGTWIGDLKKSFGQVLADLSGKPIETFFPSRDDLLGILGSLPTNDFDFLPYIIAEDENFSGTRPTDKPRFKYVGNLIVPVEACKGKEFGDARASELDRFIESCPQPPVYIGWGSMSFGSSKFMTLMAVRSLKLAGCKGVVLGGCAGLKENDLEGEADEADLKTFAKDNVLFVENAAHEILFPRCSVIVHHGGIGTTLAAVRAGRPNVVTPIWYDQFDSAESVEKCGQGIGFKKQLMQLTAQELGDAIKACLDDQKRVTTAKELGSKLKAHDGVKEATDFIINFYRESILTGKYWQSFDKLDAKKKAKRQASCFAMCM